MTFRRIDATVFFTQNNLWSYYLMIFISWSKERGKVILRNYFPLTVFTKCFIVDVWMNLGFWICQSFQYTGVLNIPGFERCFWFWICQGSGYTTALNMPGLHRILNTLDYAWMCLNLSEWLLLYIYPLSFVLLRNHRPFSWKVKIWFLLSIVAGVIWFCLLF